MKIKATWEYGQTKPGDKLLNHLLLQLETPPEVGNESKQPLAVVLVLDKSWSMNGVKIESVIEAAVSFIHWLTRNDYLGIVTYAADVQVLHPIGQLTEKKSIENRLRSISVGTSTNLSGGWLQSLHMLENVEVENAIRRCILLTDGIATMGIQDDDKLVEIAKGHSSKGITTTTIGFGSDFNETSLKEISTAGGGNFYFIDSPEKTSDIFFREFGTLGNLYAQATELKLKLADGVKLLEFIDEIPINIDNNVVTVNLGDLRNDDLRNLVFSFEIEPDKAAMKEPLIEAEIFYYNVAENFKTQTVIEKVHIGDGKPGDPNPEVRRELLIAWAGRAMIEASRMAENDLDGAIDVLENMVGRVRKSRSIAPTILEPLEKRLEQVQKKLRENAIMARKQLMASGTDIYARRTTNGISGKVVYHNNIFEHSWDGELDLYNCPELKTAIQNKLQDGYRFVVLDLSKTPFIDSSAIGALIQISNWLTRRGGMLVVAGLTPTVDKLFQITQMHSFIPVTGSVSDGKKVIQEQISRET